MGYLYQLDQTTDFAAMQCLKLWLALAEYQELGHTYEDKKGDSI